MIKVNMLLLIIAFISAIKLISLRSETRGCVDHVEHARLLTRHLEEEYRHMQLHRARLTNITRITQKSSAAGMVSLDYSKRRVLKAGD